MKAFAVPTGSGAIAAALALVFYVAFAYFYGDTQLAWVIMVTASTSLVQLATVPQGWLYVVGASDERQLSNRFCVAVVAEVLGGITGLLLLLALCALPIDFLRESKWPAALAFLGLWVAGSSSIQGLLRARRQWTLFATWALIPNVLRVLLILLLPLCARAGIAPDLAKEPLGIITTYFFAPELARFLLINMPQLRAEFSTPSVAEFVKGAQSILHNWLFDFGSSLTESGDKVLVGAIAGPYLLDTYFFARRIGAAATIVVEPFYTEHYRRLGLSGESERGKRRVVTYLYGILLTSSVSMIGVALVLIARWVPAVSIYIPQPVLQNIYLFVALLLIDSGIAANRWSRYISQVGHRSLILLSFRIALFVFFGVSLSFLQGVAPGVALGISFLVVWTLDALFVFAMLRRSIY